MRILSAFLAVMVAVPTLAAADKDGKGDRVHVRGSTIYRGSSAKEILAVQQDDLCRPGLTDEQLVKAFIRVSDVGGTALCFDLEGFSADGRAIDPDYVDTVVRLKDAANYRWMPTVVHVTGALDDADLQTRRNAVETAARTFRDAWSILYWIDGPDSETLVKAFRAKAPKLTVLAPWNGDVQLVVGESHTFPGHASLLLGALPCKSSSTKNAILPNTPESYEALERYNTQPVELQPWYPSDVGLTWQERIDGWEMLYNGHSLDGWAIVGPNKHGFVSQDGILSWNQRGGRSLQSRNRYGDFILRFEWKVYKKGANNGVWLRAPRANRASKMGFEFQILGDSGEEPNKNSTGSVYDVVAPTVNAARPEGEWNEVEIYLNGPIYKATLNGELIQDLNFDEDDELRYRLRRGFICITDHGAKASFRNIRIKELD